MSGPPRRQAVDVVRVLGVLAVVVIHAAPFARLTPRVPIGAAWTPATIANQLARFAVPCFFVLAGFFWSHGTADDDTRVARAWRNARRLALVFVAWSLVYCLPFDGTRILRDPPHGVLSLLRHDLRWFATHPGTVLLQGTQGHLWFLSALVACYALVAVALRRIGPRGLALLAVAMAIATLLAGPYRPTALGLVARFNVRNGPGFWLQFFLAGAWLAARPPHPRQARLGLACAAAGLLVSALELTALHGRYGVSLAQDFVLGTVPLGVGIAMVALADPPWARWPRVAALGPIVLGIYASHMLVLELVRPLARHGPALAADGALLAGTFLLAAGLARALARTRRLAPLVG